MAARLPYLERTQVPADGQAVYDSVQKATGWVPNIFKPMSHHARSLPPVLQWYPKLREGDLDLKLRQLAYVRAFPAHPEHRRGQLPQAIQRGARHRARGLKETNHG